MLGVLPTPAPAQPQSEVRLGGIGDIELRVGGGTQNVTIQVENRGELPAVGVQLTMTVPLSDFGVHIASAPPEADCGLTDGDTRMNCTIVEIPPGGSWNGLARIGVHGNSSLQAGETRNGDAEVRLTGSHSGQTRFNVRLQGPDQPPGVPEVSGFVTDQATGERVEGASVLLVDSQGVELTATTDSNGNFRFAGDQIAAGSIGLQARKDGYEGQQFIEQGQAGQPLSGIQLTLTSTASPTPSASPTATPTATPTGTASAVPVADSGGSGGSFFTTLLIILGIVLVLLGVGAIVFLIIRRRREQREDGGPDGADYPTSGPRGPGPVPGSHGVYRPAPPAATQVIGGRGGPLPAVGPSPALADAPTMMHQRAGAGDQTMLHQRAGAGDQTMLHQRAGAGDQTTMLPRAGEPPGPHPPMAGGPPPPRPAAPTYGTPVSAYQPTTGYDDPPGQHAGGTAYGHPAAGATGYGNPAYGSQSDPTEPGGYGAAGRHGQGVYGSPPDAGSYGPDPYTQPPPPAAGYGTPSAGYRPPGYPDQGPPDQGYPDQGHQNRSYQEQGYQEQGYQEQGYQEQGYQEQGYQDRGYRSDPYGGGGGGPDGSGAHRAGEQPGYGQPEYGQPPRDQSGYGNEYYDEAGQPRSRHSEPPERRRLDWLDDT